MSSDTNLSTPETAPSSATPEMGSDSVDPSRDSPATATPAEASLADSPGEPSPAATTTDVATTATDAAATASESESAPATTPEIVAHEPAASTPSPAAATSVSPAPTISTPPASPTAQAQAAPTPPTPAAPVADAAIAERITIAGGHSNDATTDSSGGEWELLTSKIKDWFNANDIGEQINQARQPLRLIAYFIGLLLVLKVYSGLLSAIGTIPLAPRLLELVGLCSVISFSATRLVRSNDRREVIDGLRQRWSAFSGSKN